MRKAMMMPVFFGALTILFAVGYAAVFILIPIPLVFKLIAALVYTALAAAMIYVLVQRSRELKEEEHIDLSKY